MADICFSCPRCKQHLVIDEAGAEMTVSCPSCAHLLPVPGLHLAEDLTRTQKVLPFEYLKRSSISNTPSQAPRAQSKAA
jgi:hypothetical protein